LAAKEILKAFLPGPLIKAVRSLVMGWRQVTARWRVLPDIIIVGAQKAGTTSLYAYMAGHPQLRRSHVKEVHFFDGGLDPSVDSYARGENYYRAFFPLRPFLPAGVKTYEASPLYIYHPLVAGRIARMVPGARVIALLRNPVERAISHYFHDQRAGREPLPILEAMQAEDDRVSAAAARKDFNSPDFIERSYKSRGLYAQQLQRYYDQLPEEQILVLSAEELFSRPKETLERVYDFCGVDSGKLPADLTPRNVGSNRRDVDDDVYTYLSNYFRQPNEALFELLGRRFDW